MDLSNLKPAPGSTQKRKRLGRGPGSGLGKTSGRGHKGRGARSGGNTPPGYEGGQMPLQRRLPKRGFNSPFRVEYAVVNLGQLDRLFDANDVVDLDALRNKHLVRPKAGLVKILAKGQLSKALTIKAHKFSAAARAQVEAAGGAVEVIAGA
jgi:large subunit ribosomal protein L15